MATITVRNIPDALYNRLKVSAILNHRSINGELIAQLEAALVPAKCTPEERLARIDRIRPKIPPDAMSLEEIEEAINFGRP